MHLHLRPRILVATAWGLAVTALSLAGCGDNLPTAAPACAPDDLVAIVGPAAIIGTDVDAAADGVQTTVAVRTTFAAGVELTLTVTADGGATRTTASATTDGAGDAAFVGVTVPAGGATLRVAGSVAGCTVAADEKHVEVVAGAGCELAFAVAPEANGFYAPLAVFDAEADGDAGAAGFQGEVVVRTMAGFEVTVFQSGVGRLEAAIGSGTAGADGALTLPITLPEGEGSLRAACTGPDGVGSRASLATSIFVDTVAPGCAIASPVPGTSLTPSLDHDQDLANGVQLTLIGHGDGADVAGEPASFTLTAPDGAVTALPAGDLGVDGDAAADATFDPPAPPSEYDVAFATRDHAGNACVAARRYRVVYDGCAIAVIAPTAVLTSDADADAANGAQVDIVVDVDDACIGRTLTSDCGSDDAGAVVDPGGVTVLRATLCAAVPCEAIEPCTVRVTSPDGIETSAGVELGFDNQAPNVGVQVALPTGVGCNGTVTPEQDVDAATAGVQIAMRVVSPSAADRDLRRTSASGTATFDADVIGGEVVVTVEAGGNDFAGLAADALGNVATSAICRVTLADIAVGFTGSAADGTVGPVDGTGAATGSLTFSLTGTTSASDADVAIAVDGGPAIPAIVTGTAWRADLSLAGRAAPYAIVAVATAGTRIGTGALALTVDLAAPPIVGALVGTADTRRSILLRFTAPGDDGLPAAAYRVRYATTALTDANFDATGTAFSAPAPAAPGAAEVVRVVPTRTGTAYWVGVAAVDAAGNRSAAQIVGPLVPEFEKSAVHDAPATGGDAALGYALVRGRFNDDGFEDIAVSAPLATSTGGAGAGEVYVYFGSAAGLSASPDLTIRGTTADATFGASLARLRWSSPVRDDLAIGEPFGDGGSGRVYVFHGGAAFPTGSVAATAAPSHLRIATATNWFSGSAFGWQLATADHDGDGVDDLVATAVFGAGGSSGAALVFYGGTVPAGTVFVSDASAAGSGTAVIRMYEELGFALFGYYAHNLGPTQGPTDGADDLGVGFVEDGGAGAELLVLRSAGGRPTSAGVTREPFTVGRDVRLRYDTVDAALEWGSAMGSIADQNGDGARDVVIGDFRYGSNAGIVFVVDGDTVGSAGVATTDDPGIAIATIVTGVNGAHLGMAVVNNAVGVAPDVDGDGIEDLVVVGRNAALAQAQLKVWFGPIPHGIVDGNAPDHALDGPDGFHANAPNNGGTPIQAIWAGDVNGDGLDDVCWADQTAAGRDGGFQLLWDDGV